MFDICDVPSLWVLWLEFQPRRLGAKWGCHSIIAWLTQANTSVGQSYIYNIFGFLILKLICIMFSTCICIIKGILVVSGFVLARRFQRRFSCQPGIF